MERTIVQPEVDFDQDAKKHLKQKKESTKWPPSKVYGITPQTSSTEEGSRQYRETPPVIDYYGYRPKVTQSPIIMTNTIQGTSAFVVPAKRLSTKTSDTNKGAVDGRAPLQLTPAFEEE